MSQKIRKDPFRNRNKVDLPRDKIKQEVQKLLGSNVSTKFVEWYRQDYGKRGWNIPFMNYSGPGNSTRSGKPVNEADKFAQLHDVEYAHSSFLYSNGKIDKEKHIENIRAADTKFLSSNGVNITASMDPREQLASLIGAVGIGGKQIFERVFGQQYPDTDASTTFTEHPTGEKKLANKLFSNLKSNIQSSEQSGVEQTSMEVDNKAPKRAGSSITHGGKVQVGEVSSSGANIADNMNLPGSGAASAGTSEDTMVTYETPSDHFSSREASFKKVHMLYSFGTGQNLIEAAKATPTENQFFITSSMAAIPWEYLWFYMTPGQYAMLGDNTKVDRVRVRIRHIITRQAFETAVEQTGLATLNQLSFIKVAEGLNKTSWGLDRHLGGFSAGDKMTPSTVTAPLLTVYKNLFWGTDNSAMTPASLLGGAASLTGRWVELQNYFCLATSKQQAGGLPMLRSQITYLNGHSTKDRIIKEKDYVPKMGYIKKPNQHNRWGLPQFITNTALHVAVNQNQVRCQQLNVGAAGAANDIISTACTNTNPANIAGDMAALFSYDTPIEKSQYLKHAAWGLDQKAQVQPSIHIGIDPVPSITAADGPDIPVKYVDTMGYYEVTAEMWVSQDIENPFSHATVPNVPFGSAVVYYNDPPSQNACTIGGLLPLQSIR